MTDTLYMEAETQSEMSDAERITELTALIDSFLPETINRTLMKTSEMQDFLLDLRQILNR